MAQVELKVTSKAHSINPNKGTKHHRKPKSLLVGKTAGRRKPNVIRVPRSKHEAWHTLFGNASAEEVLKLFRGYCDIFDLTSRKTKLQKEIYAGWIESRPSHIKKQEAWDHLFAGMTLDQIVFEINNRWIDPEYEISVKVKEVKKVNLTLTKKVIS